MKPMSLPVCTLSPICNSDIVTDFPFWRLRLALEGKHILLSFLVLPLQQCVVDPHLAMHFVGHLEE